jgi:hypothetical protein
MPSEALILIFHELLKMIVVCNFLIYSLYATLPIFSLATSNYSANFDSSTAGSTLTM